MTPQEQLRRERREAVFLVRFARLSPEQQRIVTGVVERMSTAGATFEDALEDVVGCRDIAHLPTWTP